MIAYATHVDMVVSAIHTIHKLRAEIRAGELLAEMAEKGERDSGRGNRNPTLKSQPATAKLSDIGVSKTSSRCSLSWVL